MGHRPNVGGRQLLDTTTAGIFQSAAAATPRAACRTATGIPGRGVENAARSLSRPALAALLTDSVDQAPHPICDRAAAPRAGAKLASPAKPDVVIRENFGSHADGGRPGLSRDILSRRAVARPSSQSFAMTAAPTRGPSR